MGDKGIVHDRRGAMQGRVISILEGGYNLEALDASVFQHVSALNEAAQDQNFGI